jgi:hypothetical protein
LGGKDRIMIATLRQIAAAAVPLGIAITTVLAR